MNGKKKANLQSNKSHIRLFSSLLLHWVLDPSRELQQFTSNLSLTHHAPLGDGQALVETGPSDTEPTAATALMESSLTDACTQ